MENTQYYVFLSGSYLHILNSPKSTNPTIEFGFDNCSSVRKCFAINRRRLHDHRHIRFPAGGQLRSRASFGWRQNPSVRCISRIRTQLTNGQKTDLGWKISIWFLCAWIANIGYSGWARGRILAFSRIYLSWGRVSPLMPIVSQNSPSMEKSSTFERNGKSL